MGCPWCTWVDVNIASVKIYKHMRDNINQGGNPMFARQISSGMKGMVIPTATCSIGVTPGCTTNGYVPNGKCIAGLNK